MSDPQDPHPVQLFLVHFFRIARIDPCDIDVAVPEQIRQAEEVFCAPVVNPCEEVPQVMGKYFLRRHARFFRQALHLPPDAAPVQRFPFPVDEDLSGTDPGRPAVSE